MESGEDIPICTIVIILRREVDLQVIRGDGKLVSTVHNKANDDERSTCRP
jgi:hypothetical protein